VLTSGASWNEGTSVAEIEVLIRDGLDQLNNYLDKVSPDSGTYFNEVRGFTFDAKSNVKLKFGQFRLPYTRKTRKGRFLAPITIA
jgi:hypothetical protein